jgi:pimeloyl-ACP methyl ester carboxylesterase
LTDRTIDAAGTSIRIRCGGDRRPGSALVVLEAGAFNTVETWRDVHAPIATFARACAHDRPGRGASGPAPPGLDASGYIALLRDLLRTSGEPPPYVIVGHSLGGLIAQLYAASHPSDIAGLVLVDSSHADQVKRFAGFPQRAAPTAFTRRPAPEAVSLEAFADLLTPSRRTLAAPIAVLTRSRWTSGADTPEDEARLEVWRELQRDLAARSPRSHHIVASDSGHYVQNDEPALVIDAVRRIAAP